MKRISSFIIVCIITFSYSCDFLNVTDYFEETLKYDSIFHNKRNIERYLWTTAYYLPDESNFFGDNYTPGPLATDEGFTLMGTRQFRGMAFALGEVKATDMYGMDIWGRQYIAIRKINTILARMDEAADLTTLDKREILGYAYFIRAYAYYHLLMQYGPLVILGDNVFETNEDPEHYTGTRSTYDESVEYICSEMEKAAEYIPSEVPYSFFGRPSKGAVYAIIARIRLQHASPAFNGQAPARRYFGNWKRSTDQAYYVSQTYDETRWAVAADAAKRVIDLGRYTLYTAPRISGSTKPLPASVSNANFPYGAGNIDAFKSYSEMFNGEALAVRNPEIIWGRRSSEVEGYTRQSFPSNILDGWNGMGLTQKVIDNYRMEDGRSIDNSSAEYPYVESGEYTGASITFSDYILRTGNTTSTNAVNNGIPRMYMNREMRFYASVGFNGCLWTCNSCTEDNKNNFIATYYIGGTSGKDRTSGNPEDYPPTGYVLRKYVHPDDAWSGNNNSRIPKSFPIIRYAEILLSYVEALNNLTEPKTITTPDGETRTYTRDIEEMRFSFNQVRFRAGLPGLTDEELASPQTIQKLIEQERMIEFLFENRRFYDVRRWGIYEATEREQVRGMDTNATRSSYLTIVPVNHSKARNRLVDSKLMFLPINLDEVRKTTLDQNPGWEK